MPTYDELTKADELMNKDIISHELEIIRRLIEESNAHQNFITDVFMKNCERFAERITKIETALFGKSED